MRPMRTRSLASASLSAIAVALTLAPSAQAAPGKLVFDGCQSSAAGPPIAGCSQLQGLSYTGAVAFSADGRSAYASFPDGISGFDRHPVTGELTFGQCLNAAGTPPCAQLPGALQTPGFLGTTADMVVTQDGTSLYAAGGGANAGEGRPTLLAFQRNPASGQLTFVSCNHSSYGAEGDLPSCAVGNFQEARQVESSLDGRAIYLLDWGCADNTGDCFADVVAYERNPQTSVLTAMDRSDPATSGLGPFAVSRGAGNVYQLDSKSGAISVFKRIGAANLRFVQCLWPVRRPGLLIRAHRCTTRPSMGRAKALALSADGRTVVTAIGAEGGRAGLAVFHRAPNGKLGLRGVLGPVKGLGASLIGQLEFAANGRSLYAVAASGPGRFLARFKVNAKRGKIAFAQCLAGVARKGCAYVPQLRGLTEITLGGGLVYAAVADANVAAGPNALVRFRPEPKR